MEQKTPRLLTEAEWRKRLSEVRDIETAIAALDSAGLIADEPVDPDLLEAREILVEWARETWGSGSYQFNAYKRGDFRDDSSTRLALAALKRGKELRPPLTRKMVRAAWRRCADNGPYTAEALHAAIMEQMQ